MSDDKDKMGAGARDVIPATLTLPPEFQAAQAVAGICCGHPMGAHWTPNWRCRRCDACPGWGRTR